MSGHSKWATIKHKKAATDKARAKTWMKAIRNIEIAAREGGGDVNANATLRTMVQKAKAEQVPNDKIDNAIKRATGELKAEVQDSITYEGYAPAGVAVLVEVLTDNRNRAASDVRAAFSKNAAASPSPGRWRAVRAPRRDPRPEEGGGEGHRRGRGDDGRAGGRRRGRLRHRRGLRGAVLADRRRRGLQRALRRRHPVRLGGPADGRQEPSSSSPTRATPSACSSSSRSSRSSTTWTRSTPTSTSPSP